VAQQTVCCVHSGVDVSNIVTLINSFGRLLLFLRALYHKLIWRHLLPHITMGKGWCQEAMLLYWNYPKHAEDDRWTRWIWRIWRKRKTNSKTNSWCRLWIVGCLIIRHNNAEIGSLSGIILHNWGQSCVFRELLQPAVPHQLWILSVFIVIVLHGPCRADLHTCGLAQSPSCDCDQRQTMIRIVTGAH